MRFLFIKIILLLTTSFALGQTKQHIATRITEPPKIDGNLNDACWQDIAYATDFATNDPVFGLPASQKTEVKFVYDDDAIYLAYSLYDDEPHKIIKTLCDRDKNSISDELMLGIDPYGDKTSAFRFQLNAAGVQFDRFMSPFIARNDRSWDAIWQSAVVINDEGWFAEIKIPLSSIRYPKKPIQEWTIQFGRYLGRSGEYTTWSPVNNNIGGGPMRQWGNLIGIQDIKPKTRLSLSPYFTIGLQQSPSLNSNERNYTNKIFYSGGADLKYGISQNYTLDMSLVPDFSQVQSDNTILNITPFEVKYDERRQFFTEGAELYGKAGIFYSRRIGAVPAGYSTLTNQLQKNEKITENNSVTGIINAVKISGRHKNGFGVGVLNAITENVYAKIKNDSTKVIREVLTEPAANYNVIVLDQSLKNNSKIGIINTNVMRSASAIDANVTALDFILNSKGSIYALTGTAIYSYRKGASLVGGKQGGYNYKLDFAKISKKFRFEVYSAAVDKNYNCNDLGILAATNYMQHYFALKYFTITPVGKLLNWNTILSYTHTNTLSDMSFQRSDVDLNVFGLFKNFSTLILNSNWRPGRTVDIYEPRVSDKKFIRPKSFKQAIQYATDSRKRSQLLFSVSGQWFEFPKQHYSYEVSIAPILRIGNKLILSPAILYAAHANNQGFTSIVDKDNIIFGLRQEQSVETSFTFQYFFSAYHNLSFRVRDYWSKIRYDEYYKLQDDGSLAATTYTKNADVNLNLFNIDMIYTWQLGPGSFMSASWKKNIAFQNKSRSDDYFNSFSNTLVTPGSDNFSLRLIYYLDYWAVKKQLNGK